MAHAAPSRFRFFRAGGVDQVVFRSGADLAALGELDQKLWMALAMPTRGVEFDPRTADLIDTDKDGRIRPPELIAAVKWTEGALKELGEVMRGGDRVALSSIKDPDILAGARRLLTNLRKPEAAEVTLADVSDTVKIYAETTFNGDGVVPADAADEPATRQAIEDVIAVMGPVTDRSGKPGVNLEKLDAFFAQADAFSAWLSRGEASPEITPGGLEAAIAAAAAIAAVRAKVDDYFARCNLAAFDARATSALNRDEKDFAALAGQSLTVAAPEIAAFPLARIEPGKPLPLEAGVNPAWAERLATLNEKALAPLLGKRQAALSEQSWAAVLQRIAPHQAWVSSRPTNAVEKLGIARIRELLASGAKDKISALIAQDAALAKEVAQLDAVEKLVRMQRDLFALCTNYVSFADFYGKKGATFQAGTLFLDARSCELCVEVTDPAKHAALAQLSAGYLAYCDLARAGEAKRQIVAVFTDGDSDNLMVGRNGVFYDRKGRDWDATITKIVSNPISIREAFWLPYKKLIRLIEEQISKRAQAADAESQGRLSETATRIATVDKPAAPAKHEEKKLDLGTIALIGTAIGGISALMGGFMTSLFGLGFWMPLGVLGLVLLISGPSMLLAYLKLRQRNLGPILDANGWAINTKAKMNVPFGAALTHVARLPAGAERSLEDPFAEHHRPWKTYLFLLVLFVLSYGWLIGRLDGLLPDPLKKSTLLPTNAQKTAPPSPAAVPQTAPAK